MLKYKVYKYSLNAKRWLGLFQYRLKSLREGKRLYQKELANELSISRASIAMYESGDRMPPVEVLIKLADFFNVSIDYLLGQDGKKWEEKEKLLCNKSYLIINRLKDELPDLSDIEKEILEQCVKFSLSQIKKLRQ